MKQASQVPDGVPDLALEVLLEFDTLNEAVPQALVLGGEESALFQRDEAVLGALADC